MKVLLGIDFGTGGCKVTAIACDGTLLADASVEYTTYHEHPGWSEQEPSDWYKAICAALAKLAAKGVNLHDVAALSLDGSTHNAVLLDDAMRPLRRTIMWTDQRATDECAELKRDRGDEIFATCYQMPAPTWTLPQLMWLRRHEPEIIARTRHVLFVKDYVRFLLTDSAETDRIEAQGTLFFDMKASRWSDELTALCGLRPDALPRLVEPTDCTGAVTARAASETGLKEGTPVICGTSDSAVEDYGAGAVEPGDLIIKLATAGNVNSMTAAAHPHPKTLTYAHVVPGMWYSVSATNAAALCQRWMRDTFFKDISAPDGRNLYNVMDEEAAQSPIGAGGVMFHPYLQGERCPYWDADLRASFTGVSIASTRADFCRSLLEGVAFSLRDCYGTLEEMGLDVKRIFLIGGGAKSALWSDIVCNVFGKPAAVPSPADASFGAALLAGVGTGVFADARSAVNQCLHLSAHLVPRPEAVEQYTALYAWYKAVHDALAPVYSKFS